MNKDKDIINMDNGVGTAAADCSNRDRLLAKVLDAACAKIKMWRVVICKDDGTLLEDRHEIISALEYAHYVNPVAKDYTNTMESVAVTAPLVAFTVKSETVTLPVLDAFPFV